MPMFNFPDKDFKRYLSLTVYNTLRLDIPKEDILSIATYHAEDALTDESYLGTDVILKSHIEHSCLKFKYQDYYYESDDRPIYELYYYEFQFPGGLI